MELDLSAELDNLTTEESGEGEADQVGQQETSEQSLDDQPNQESEESAELSPEDMLNSLDDEKAEDSDDQSKLLEQLNSLGAIHKGNPVKVESLDQVKDALQMAHDYQVKTTELAEQRKTLEAEYGEKMETFEKERNEFLETHGAELDANAVFSNVVRKIQANDPDLFNEILQMYNEENAKFQDARKYEKTLDSKFRGLEEKLTKYEQKEQETKVGEAREGFESELKEVQSNYAVKLNKLGVSPDWDKVKETWANSANMSVNQALFAVHGDAIQKAYESHQKMLATKNKAQKSHQSRNVVNKTSQGSEENNYRAGSYEQILNDAI